MIFPIRTLLIIYCITIFALLLWPYGFVIPCQGYLNGAAWIANENQVEFQTAGLISTSLPFSLYEKIASASGFSIAIWLTPDKLEQEGPARIVSYSKDPFYRNFTLGQEDDALVFRLRTSNTNLNGTSPEITVPGIFATGQRRQIVVNYDLSHCDIYVDGQLRDRVDFPPGGNFANWDADYPLLIGNEQTGDRPWLGNIEQIRLYGRPMSAAGVKQNYRHNGGSSDNDDALAVFDFDRGEGNIIYGRTTTESDLALEIPGTVINQDKCDFLTPELEKRKLMDFINNFSIFFVFGVLFFLDRCARFRSVFQVILTTFCTTLVLAFAAESLQYYVAARTSSLFDLFSSLSGGLAASLIMAGLRIQQRYRH